VLCDLTVKGLGVSGEAVRGPLRVSGGRGCSGDEAETRGDAPVRHKRTTIGLRGGGGEGGGEVYLAPAWRSVVTIIGR
jgi:hypothetical protein